jgi:hypothetical protein
MKVSERKAQLLKKGQIEISENQVEYTCVELLLLRAIGKYVHKHHCEDIHNELLIACLELIEARHKSKNIICRLSNLEIAWVHRSILKQKKGFAPSPVIASLALKVAENSLSRLFVTTVLAILDKLPGIL